MSENKQTRASFFLHSRRDVAWSGGDGHFAQDKSSANLDALLFRHSQRIGFEDSFDFVCARVVSVWDGHPAAVKA